VIIINYFDERELLVRKEMKTKSPKSPNSKITEVLSETVIKSLCNIFALLNYENIHTLKLIQSQ